mmetsp:Transcript_29454/g.85874  ORF Transcript_29454/g.85874 Transcript_29454/m.85874 type:complete len:102 (-) Transcript_29454:1603-1908(-)
MRISSSWHPCSATWPPRRKTILSARRTVLKRWAMTKVVRRCPSARSRSSAACTTRSLLLSNALVASSRMSIFGWPTRALAMATLCFCPPLSWLPPWPTGVA